jgi:hypothetical protein
MNGFLGTGATFRADFNLVVQITMGLALLTGMLLARRKQFRAHKYCQSSVMFLNIEHRFESPGVYRYYCTFHGDKHGQDMAGIITVTSPSR